MRADLLATIVEKAGCRVFGHEDAGNDAHREVLAALIRGFDRPDATVLCEPSLARKTTRPPDCVLVDPVAGVHVVEVKGVTLDQIEAIVPGGLFAFRYNGVVSPPKSPVAQVRMAMFDIKNAAEQTYPGELSLPFKYWVVLPSISRASWHGRWGGRAYAPPELLFAEDLPRLADSMRAVGQRQLSNLGLDRWPADQFACVWKAFGDSSVLYHVPEEREARRVPEATLGELFDEAAEAYKTLSDEQQRLSAQDWSGGPRLVRGVAGSGKTIVLANNLARRLQRALGGGETLFESAERPRLLAVCYNRTLVPLVRQKIDLAFRQRTGRPLPDDAVEVWHYNRLLWHLSRKGLWRYQTVDSKGDEGRVGQYLAELGHVRERQPDLLAAVAYDAIYVDEGQDFLEDDFRLLKGLCRTPQGGEPDLHIFYDDAQNLLGRRRPNWKSLGLKIIGRRSHVMTQCFRNTRPLVEAAFNVLYGRFADEQAKVPTRDFGDLATLEEKGLIEDKGDRFEVRFAVRDGMPPRLTIAPNIQAERRLMVERLGWLVGEQHVRPEDILVLAPTWLRVDGLAGAIRSAGIPAIEGVHVARDEQDRILRKRGCLSLATVASAKGYDAYCTLLASANEFTTDVSGRAGFYVGCTRAIEYLEVFANERAGLVVELERALARLGAEPVVCEGASPRRSGAVIHHVQRARGDAVSRSGLVKTQATDANYLDDRLVAGYFEAREHETYYRSLKHANPRRDFHEVIIPVLMDFVGEVLSSPDPKALDAILSTPAAPRDGRPASSDPVEEARALHPAGFDLLRIGDALNFEALKSAYRQAALRCHPDKGGSHGQMVLVNEAYSLFHGVLCRRQMMSGGEEAVEGSVTGLDVPVRTAKDYLYVVGLLLLEIKLDEWGLDDAHYWVTTLASDEWMEAGYARHPRTRANLLFPCSTLAGRLWGAGLRDQAQEVYKVAEESLGVAVRNDLYHGNGLSEADSYIKGGQKLRVVLNHRRQADNALRLGLIDGKRYGQTIERLEGKKEQAGGREREHALRLLVSEVGFLPDLPTDRAAQGKIQRAKLVPEPGYFAERLEMLSDDQQAEYLRAFGPGTDLGLVRKYVHVRAASLLRSMILHDGEVELSEIERECTGLAGFQVHPAASSCEQVADVARFLRDSDPVERRARCETLRRLDEKATDAPTITLLSSGEVEQTHSTFRVRLNHEYLNTIRLPLERLRLALDTGSTRTKGEEAQERAVWDRDMTLINSLRDGDDYKAAWDALDRAKDAPEEVVRLAVPCVEKLLEHGGAMVHTEYLNVGYWIDKITIAMTRLKRWDEARGWLERFFALPERSQKGSSPGERDSMKKRLERCRKVLGG